MINTKTANNLHPQIIHTRAPHLMKNITKNLAVIDIIPGRTTTVMISESKEMTVKAGEGRFQKSPTDLLNTRVRSHPRSILQTPKMTITEENIRRSHLNRGKNTAQTHPKMKPEVRNPRRVKKLDQDLGPGVVDDRFL